MRDRKTLMGWMGIRQFRAWLDQRYGLKVDVPTVEDWIRRGLPYKRRGATRTFDPRWVEPWMDKEILAEKDRRAS